MKVKQISIFLENKAGRLAEVTSILGEENINIRALSLADTSDFGILRLIVNDPQRAAQALKSRGFTVGETEVLAVEVPDRPGGLGQILSVLHQAGMNVEYMYAFVERSSDNAVIIFRFDNIDEAIRALLAKGVTILKGEKVYSL
ncbi:MAG: ACT domain-containing protein [candidate division NC10 bacterium]|nr:ACT domain-containing protein [candidate division NC10 bacterium]